MPKKSSSDGFFSGLIIGLVAGSFHSFLHYTEEGQEFRRKLSHQWQLARQEMLQQGLIDSSVPADPTKMLEYVWRNVAYDLGLIKQRLEVAVAQSGKKSQARPTKKTKKRAKKAKKPRLSLPRRFKGV